MLLYRHHITTALLFGSLVLDAQPPVTRNGYKQNILSIAYFIESANNSVNSFNGLLKKDNYRNKITSLNNPANNDLGFNLKSEILTALKPLLAKAKKTDTRKFKEVIENFLSKPEENGIGSVKQYLPALGIFSTVLSLVGNLVIIEKTITQQDLNEFVNKIQQYFIQYEKLNALNEEFAQELEDLLERSAEAKEDLKEFLVECTSMLYPALAKQSLKEMQVEILIQKYYDPQKLQIWLDTAQVNNDRLCYPPDAPTSAKLLTSRIKKLQKEFEGAYRENYRQLKELMASLKTSIPNLDQEQIEKTKIELEKLYSDSRQADIINLNITLVDERMNTVCRNINSGNY